MGYRGHRPTVTESEQVKAALAALAEGEPARGTATGKHGRQRREQDGPERGGGPPDERTGGGVAHAQGTAFGWGANGTAAQADTGEGGVATDYRAVIERAADATEDIEAAAGFVESVGLDRLEWAVERAEHEVSGLAADGREALATFERFRAAAAGPVEA